MTLIELAGKALSSKLGFLILNAVSREGIGHLYDDDGTLYMGRWNIIDEGTWQSKVLDELFGYKSVRLHLIARPDKDRDLHNHPFNYRTFVLRGAYTEEIGGVLLPCRRELRQGDSAVGYCGTFHRIAKVPVEGVWTLFFMDENTDKWGFLVGRRYMDRRLYSVVKQMGS